MNQFFSDLARRFAAAGITADAVEDVEGRPCALRFYLDGKAFEVRPELVEGERLPVRANRLRQNLQGEAARF